MASIRKRTWESGGKTQKTQTAWLVDYTDQNGARHIKTFALRREAEEWRAKTQVQVLGGIHTPDYQSLTVRDTVAVWHKDCESNLAAGTIRNRETHAKNYILPSPIADIKLARLTAPDIHRFNDWLREKASPPLAREIFRELRAMLAFAHGRDLVKQNVAASIKPKRLPKPERQEVGVDIPTKAEIALLLQTAPDWWRTLFVVAAFTGMRSGEIRALTWGDIDWDKRLIHVRRAAEQYGRFKSTKSRAGYRAIPMSPTVFTTLRQHEAFAVEYRFTPHSPKNTKFRHKLTLRAATEAGIMPPNPAPAFFAKYCPANQRHLDRLEKLAKNDDWEGVRNYKWGGPGSPGVRRKNDKPDNARRIIETYQADLLLAHEVAEKVVGLPRAVAPTDLVFPNSNNTVIQQTSLNVALADTQAAAGIVNEEGEPKYTMHKLRHFYASWLIDGGFRSERIKELVGHASIAITYDVYGHLFPNADDDLDKLAKAETALFTNRLKVVK